jgi:cell division protein FtsW
LSQVYRTKPDYMVLFITMCLVSIGILMVFSASPIMGIKIGNSYYYLLRHIIAVIIGIFAIYAGYITDLDWLKEKRDPIIIFSGILLLAVLLPFIGTKISGAHRWLNLGVLLIQPSEIAKLGLIIYLASKLPEAPLSRQGLSILIAAIFMLLVLKEPDLGTTVVIASIFISMIFLAGAETKHIAAMLVLGLVAVIVLGMTVPHMKSRLMSYMDPNADPMGKSYQINQSLIAVGSGGFFGMGPGKSGQKFLYLTQNYTDFIFAIFCEEWGMLGAVVVVGLFLSFFGRGIKLARNATDDFKFLLSAGIVCWITMQAFVNIAVVLSLIPATGIPLPFISYGGTSLVILLYAVGLLLNISTFRRAAA